MGYTAPMPAKKGDTTRPIPVIDFEQSHAEAFLGKLERGRIPSLLFSGPAGTGKELTAIHFARRLCCKRPTPCDVGGTDVCTSCLQASLLEHPGIHLIYPTPTQGSRESEDGDIPDIARILEEKRADVFSRYRFSKKTSIRIARSRAVIQRASMKPFDSPFDIFVFVDAHSMREEAQNALLKLVEEPPGHAALIFITTNPEAILHTIRSRCQHVRFTPLGVPVVERTLRQYYNVDEATARRAAAMSHGSIVRARELVDAYDENERDAATSLVAGIAREGRAWALGRALTIGRGANREGVARLLDEVAVVFRDIMSGDASLYINRDSAAQIDKLASEWDRREIPGVIDRVTLARNEILLANASVDSTLADLFVNLKRAG